MGHSAEVKCQDCGKIFEVSYGGGFSFHLLGCDKCGKTKSILFDEIPELHQRYIKGLSGPYCIASAEHDKRVQQNVDVKPLSEAEYHEQIENQVGVANVVENLFLMHCQGVQNAGPRILKSQKLLHIMIEINL